MNPKRSRLYVVNCVSQPQIVVPSNSNRISLIFLSNPQGYYSVSTESMLTENDGVLINTTYYGLKMNIEEFGDIVQKEWLAWVHTAPAKISYVELLGT